MYCLKTSRWGLEFFWHSNWPPGPKIGSFGGQTLRNTTGSCWIPSPTHPSTGTAPKSAWIIQVTFGNPKQKQEKLHMLLKTSTRPVHFVVGSLLAILPGPPEKQPIVVEQKTWLPGLIGGRSQSDHTYLEKQLIFCDPLDGFDQVRRDGVGQPVPLLYLLHQKIIIINNWVPERLRRWLGQAGNFTLHFSRGEWHMGLTAGSPELSLFVYFLVWAQTCTNNVGHIQEDAYNGAWA